MAPPVMCQFTSKNKFIVVNLRTLLFFTPQPVCVCISESADRRVISLKQIRADVPNGYLVIDDILYGGNREIPLYLFGFLY